MDRRVDDLEAVTVEALLPAWMVTPPWLQDVTPPCPIPVLSRL